MKATKAQLIQQLEESLRLNDELRANLEQVSRDNLRNLELKKKFADKVDEVTANLRKFEEKNEELKEKMRAIQNQNTLLNTENNRLSTKLDKALDAFIARELRYSF